jgi:hypothetical protein
MSQSSSTASALNHQTDPFLSRLRAHYLSKNAPSKYDSIELFAKTLTPSEWNDLKGDSPSSPEEERAVFDTIQRFIHRCGPDMDPEAFRRLVLSSRVILDSQRFKILDAMRTLAVAERNQSLLKTMQEGRGDITFKLRVRFMALSRNTGHDDLIKAIEHWAVLNRKFINFEILEVTKRN